MNTESTAYYDNFQNLQTVTACIQKRDELMNNGQVLELKQLLQTAQPDEKKTLGQQLGVLRLAIQTACDQRIAAIQELREQDNFTQFDPTFHSNQYKTARGSLHPLTQIVREIVDIFARFGFDVYTGSLVEKQWYNFTSVNTPDYHPARDMQDTFFLKQTDEQGENYVLRTQVTANAVKYAEKYQPPFKVIFPGIVFRNENIDATHDINFTQFDMWLVDRKVTTAQLITLIKKFFQEFFEINTLEVRLRPSYFPFTQPSLEGDISCPFCSGKGCRICKQTGWIEVFGAGPIHTEVIKNMGLNPDEWEGIAFGFGVDRLAQLKLGVSGVAQFYNGNLKFLKGV